MGDWLALILIGALMALGFATWGYMADVVSSALGVAICLLLGAWGLLGWALGRLDGAELTPARWLLAAQLVVVAGSALFLIPIPAGIAASLSPAWAENFATMREVGITPPTHLPFAQNPELAWSVATQTVAAFGLLICALMIGSTRMGSRRLLAIVLAVSLLEGILGLLSWAFGGSVRARGGVFNPNHHAALTLMGIPAMITALYLVRTFSRRYQGPLLEGDNPLILGVVALLAAMVGWLAGLSRSSIVIGTVVLGIGGTLLWRFAAERRHRPQDPGPAYSRVVVGIVATVAGLFALLALEPLLRGGLARAGDISEQTHLWRTKVWEATLEGLWHTNGLGLGPGGAIYAINRHVEFPTDRLFQFTHNDYVQFVAEMGLPLSLVVATLVGLGIWSWVRFVREEAQAVGEAAQLVRWGLVAGLLTALLHAITDFHFRVPLVHYQAILITALAVTPGIAMMAVGGTERPRKDPR